MQAKHLNLDVQRVAVRCLGLYGLLERRSSEEVVRQLSFSFVKGPSSISLLAGKGLIDLVMWHGPQEVDRSIGEDFLSQIPDNGLHLTPEMCNKVDGDNIGVLDLLTVGLESDFVDQTLEYEENESVQATLGEGFAKILLLSENYPSIPGSLHSLILAKLIALYFSEENIELQRYITRSFPMILVLLLETFVLALIFFLIPCIFNRLKQCLSVFFEHYPSLSVNHKVSGILPIV